MKGKLVNEHLESCSKYCDNFPTISIITASVNCLNIHKKTDFFSECIKQAVFSEWRTHVVFEIGSLNEGKITKDGKEWKQAEIYKAPILMVTIINSLNNWRQSQLYLALQKCTFIVKTHMV